MLDLKCLECTENGIRFLSTFWSKNENMHGAAARSIIFGRQEPAKEAKWVHNDSKKGSYQGRLGSENDICNAMCSKSVCKIMLPAGGGKHFLIKSCEIIPSRRRVTKIGLIFTFCFVSFRGMTGMMHICASLVGLKSRKGGPLCSKHTVLRRFVRLHWGGHKAKEKGTKEQRSDASKKK